MAGRYITQNRIKRVRWEESLARAIMKREHPGKVYPIHHWTCSCGSMGCMAIPTIKDRRFRDNGSAVDNVALTPSQAKQTLKNRKKRAKKITITEYNSRRYGYV